MCPAVQRMPFAGIWNGRSLERPLRLLRGCQYGEMRGVGPSPFVS
jgi:hypothetical protein